MENQVGSKEIDRLLRLKGNSRLGVKDETTEFILNLNMEKYPGLKLEFLESRRRKLSEDEWFEYYVLYSIPKFDSTPKFVGHSFTVVGNLVKEFDCITEIDSFGVQDIDTSKANLNYVLFYILRNGREEIESCKN